MNTRSRLFQPVFVEATTLNDCWHQLLINLYEKGRRYPITSGSFEGAARVAFDDVSGFIHMPHERPLAPIMPEGLSVPPPTTEEAIEEYFREDLMNNRLEVHQDYKYAVWLFGGPYQMPVLTGLNTKDRYNVALYRSFEDTWIVVPNQVEWVIKHFQEKGFGNEHCYITVGYPESNQAYDREYSNPNERKTSPCLRGLDFRVIQAADGRHYLTLKVIYRSWDLWAGWPTNMGGFALLAEYMAIALGIEAGPMSFTCKSLHCYDFQIDALCQRLRKPNLLEGTRTVTEIADSFVMDTLMAKEACCV